jgi:hypothetical protein
MKRCSILAAALLAVAASVLVVSLGTAQVLPVENHYKVYWLISPPQDMNMPVILKDQFGEFTVNHFTLEKLATPVDKNDEGMVDPEAHQLWWIIDVPQPSRTVTVFDQFGGYNWELGYARYLVNPALKNVTDPEMPLPSRNHYLCYEAYGPDHGIQVTLTDQFGTVQAVVLDGAYFCNPVEKTVVDGETWPIVDPFAHLACYRIDADDPPVMIVDALDQFGWFDLEIAYNECLCVPAIKEDTNPVEESTWGRIKALYGED